MEYILTCTTNPNRSTGEQWPCITHLCLPVSVCLLHDWCVSLFALLIVLLSLLFVYQCLFTVLNTCTSDHFAFGSILVNLNIMHLLAGTCLCTYWLSCCFMYKILIKCLLIMSNMQQRQQQNYSVMHMTCLKWWIIITGAVKNTLWVIILMDKTCRNHKAKPWLHIIHIQSW